VTIRSYGRTVTGRTSLCNSTPRRRGRSCASLTSGRPSVGARSEAHGSVAPQRNAAQRVAPRLHHLPVQRSATQRSALLLVQMRSQPSRCTATQARPQQIRYARAPIVHRVSYTHTQVPMVRVLAHELYCGNGLRCAATRCTARCRRASTRRPRLCWTLGASVSTPSHTTCGQQR
jgi:hypothetical protein